MYCISDYIGKSPQLPGAIPEASKVGTQEICDELQLVIARYLQTGGNKQEETMDEPW